MARYAIVIGIDAYKNVDWNLTAAVDDAVRFAEWALGPGGVEPENLRLLLNSETARPTPVPSMSADSRTIRKTILEFQKGAGDDGERLYVYFGGHGLSSPGATKGVAQEPILLPADVESIELDYTMFLGFSDIITVLNRVPPAEQFFFIDACRDFALEDFLPAIGRAVGPWAPDRSEDALSRQFVLYATSPGQRAFERKAVGRGVFGSALLDALQGKKPAAAVWSSGADRYEVRFSSLAEHLKAAVEQRVMGMADRERYVQLPEPWSIRGADSVLAGISADDMGKLRVRVRVGPSKARETCRISLLFSPPGMPQGSPVQEVGPPAAASTTLEVAPGDYALQAHSAGYTPYREPCPIFEARSIDLRLVPMPPGGGPSAPPGRPALPTGSGSLVVDCDDPTAEIVVRDIERTVTGRSRGRLTVDPLELGIYRVQLVTVDGVVAEQLVEVQPGDPTEVRLEAPGPRMGTDQLRMLEALDIHTHNGYLHPSERLDGFANARFASLLALAAFAAHWPVAGDFERLCRVGVTSLSATAPGRAGLMLLVGASGDRPAPGLTWDRFLRRSEFVARNLSGETLALGGLERLAGLPAAAQATAELDPGGLTVELRLPGLAPTRYVLTALPDRVTVLVAVAEDGGEVEVQQYLLPVRPIGDDYLALAPENVRRLELAQRYYASQREVPEGQAVDSLLDGKWLDPLLGALAGYSLVRAGRKERYGQAALYNMLTHFDGLPDSHILAGLCQPDQRDQHFATALERGLPVFADGFRALYRWYQDQQRHDPPLWVQPSLLLPASPWTAWVASRPALVVEEGTFGPAPAGWAVLERERAEIERTLASVGRLVRRDEGPMFGTAFVVGPRVAMTMLVQPEQWTSPFIFELTDGPTPVEFEVEAVLALEGPDTVPVTPALLQLATRSKGGAPLPPPLPLAADPPEPAEGRPVYAAGYPMEDSRVPADVRHRIFGDRYGVKRLQPGQLLAVTDEVVQHDCLTLGGNMGSPIVDLATGLVLACHHSGRWVDYKRGDAAPLWKLHGHPALAEAGAEFR